MQCLERAHEDIRRLLKENDRLREALRIIAFNAKLRADPSMNFTTDIYILPLDDIEMVSELLEETK